MGDLWIPVDEDLRSLYVLGVPSFRFEAPDDDLSQYRSGLVNWHHQDSAELSYVTEGALRIRVLQQERVLRAGQGFLVFPECLHTVLPVEGEAGRYRTLLFDLELISGGLLSLIHHRYIEPTVGEGGPQLLILNPQHEWAADILARARRIVEIWDQRTYGDELRIVSELSGIWFLIAARALRPEGRAPVLSAAEQQRAAQLIAFIRQHHREPLKLEDIARSANISRGECCRFFKRMMHMSPFAYLTQYRILQSLPLLEAGELSITQISEHIGFSSASYFTSTFKRHMGIPPSAHRKGHA